MCITVGTCRYHKMSYLSNPPSMKWIRRTFLGVSSLDLRSIRHAPRFWVRLHRVTLPSGKLTVCDFSNGPFIDELPIKDGDFRYVSHYQRVLGSLESPGPCFYPFAERPCGPWKLKLRNSLTGLIYHCTGMLVIVINYYHVWGIYFNGHVKYLQ